MLKLNNDGSTGISSLSFANSNKTGLNKSPSPDRIWTDRDLNPRLAMNN